MTPSIAALVELARSWVAACTMTGNVGSSSCQIAQGVLAIFGTSADPCGYEASDMAEVHHRVITIHRNAELSLAEARFALRTLAAAIQQLAAREAQGKGES